MIAYATLGTNDSARALAFWDALFAGVGVKRLMQMPDAREFTLYGTAMNRPMLAITRPWDGGTAVAGNGTMVALSMDSRAQVDAVHAHAIELGAVDDGAPGTRGPAAMGLYFAYFRDPDGNKIALLRMGAD